MRNYTQKIERRLSENPFMPISVVTTEVLRDLILACELMPGERLKESELASMLGVSRTTVRSAFDFLLREGMLVHAQKQGVFVAELSRTKYMKIAEIRLMLDAFSARLAAQRRSDDDLMNMRKYQDILRATDLEEEYARADIGFHAAIYAAGKNEYISEISKVIGVDLVRVKMFGSANMLSLKDRVAQQHEQILTAIAARADKEAYELARNHAKIMLDPEVMIATFGE